MDLSKQSRQIAVFEDTQAYCTESITFQVVLRITETKECA